jgi:mono/diheme cytochrome c family protein
LKHRVAICLLGVMALMAGSFGLSGEARAQAASPTAAGAGVAPASDPGAAALADLGRRTYIGMCARCHGINLVTQGIGFDLRKFPADGRERFNKSVTQGVKAMPGFGTSISPAQLDGLWAYLGSVNGWK